jgi:tryptophanyl-tRNA synthetase
MAKTRKSRRTRRNEICPLCGLVNPLFRPTKAQAEFRARLARAYVEAFSSKQANAKAIDELLRELIRENRIRII